MTYKAAIPGVRIACGLGLLIMYLVVTSCSTSHKCNCDQDTSTADALSPGKKLPAVGQNNMWWGPFGVTTDSTTLLSNEKIPSDTVIIFVHGWNSDSLSAWLANDRYWPDIVARDKPTFDGVDIFLAGYPTTLNAGAIGVAEAAQRLWFAIGEEHEEVLQRRNIIFIAHSAGGLVTQQMLVHHWQEFQDKKVGVILIGSPSYGAKPAGILDWIALLYKDKFALELKPGSDFIEELDNNFKDLRNGNKIPNLAGVEAIENYALVHTKFIPDFEWFHVVQRDSAGRHFGALQTMEGTDHRNVVTPQNRNHPSHKLITRFFKRFKSIPLSSKYNKHVALNFAITREYGEAFEQALKLYESSRNVLYRLHGGSFSIQIHNTNQYAEAYAEFRDGKNYDVVMMDDPWVAELSSTLWPLSQLNAYQSFFLKTKFEDIFIPALRRSCIARGNTNTLYALPVLNNVQVLMDSSGNPPSIKSAYTDNRFKSLETAMEWLRKRRPEPLLPFISRYKTHNEIVSIFWSLLRWSGWEDKDQLSDDEPILIPRGTAEIALEFLKKAHKISGIDASKLGIEEVKDEISKKSWVAWGWPNWMGNYSDSKNKIRLINVLPKPVIGAWVLGIPKTSSHPEEAMEAILTLTTQSQFQTYMAEQGAVPVLNNFLGTQDHSSPQKCSDECQSQASNLNRRERWKHNWAAVEQSLISGTARPRHIKWRELETKLGQQIYERVFEDVKKPFQDAPGLFKFTSPD